jgi:alpha-tubulin suppressor-like RCC1 family protein
MMLLASATLLACGGSDSLLLGQILAGPEPSTEVSLADAGDSAPNASEPDAALEAAADAFAPDAVDAAAPCVVEAGTTYLLDAIQLASSGYETCALRQNGSVACWGGTFDRLGPRPATMPAPTVDGGAVAFTVIAKLSIGVCAIETSGNVWCWGYAFTGDFGTGSPDAGWVDTPARVIDTSGNPIVAVDLGSGVGHMCALTSQGKVLCWGSNNAGQLGSDAGRDDAGDIASPVAIEVPGVAAPGGTLAKGTGGWASTVVAGSAAMCWGDNGSGQCGNVILTSEPVFNPHLGADLAAAGVAFPLRALSAGEMHACALDQTRQVYCFGDNYWGECGSAGTNGPTARAVPDLADAGVVEIAAGWSNTCVVDGAQHARCFGRGLNGILGTGDVDASSTPVPSLVVGLDGGGALFPVAHVSTGGYETYAILAGACGPSGPGQVVCWGDGQDDGLGNDTYVPNATPVPVLAPK